ncbi:MAG TPA: non-heme iron oxygenase ferredoxin subunit [Gammaproteobacteria bacterium]|nr:non-heme iron oxygenase ferredoxin subunit [Gammaproteobacteria bacterium]
MSDWINVAAASELPPGQFAITDFGDIEIAVINVDGEFYAIEDVCTHDGGELTGGVIEGDQIECPRHGARFCIRTGAVLAPPAYEDISTFPCRVEAGMVQVRDNRDD